MKILSPYTVTSKDKKRIYICLICFAIIVVFLIIGYIVIRNNSNDDFVDSKVSYRIGD